jgi:vacuolar-type H+-ATPase subunit F/Vma7
MKAYVVGDKDVVLGFQLVGIKGIPVSSREEALQALRTAANMVDVKVVFITEDFSALIYDEITALRSQTGAPLIVEMPGRLGVTGELYSVQKLLQKMTRTRV